MTKKQLIEMVRRVIIEESNRLNPGDKLIFNAASRREIENLKQNPQNDRALNKATHYPADQIYVFLGYDGSNARIYPEGGHRSDDQFSVNADRFQKV